MDLEKIQEKLAEIYPNKDISLDFEINKIISNCGLIASNYEKNSSDAGPFIEVFAWAASIFSRSNVLIWRCFLQKFPDCCPLCLAKPCVCELTGKLPRSVHISKRLDELRNRYEAVLPPMEMRSFEKDLGEIPYTAAPPLLDQVVSMLRAIYLVNNTIYRHNPDFFFCENT